MATAQEIGRRKVERTEHPHIVRDPGIAGGRPIIEDSRIRVELIAGLHRRGVEAWEIIGTYPYLKPAAVYDAISYYLDHQAEIDPIIDEAETLAEQHRGTFYKREDGAFAGP